MAKNRWDEAQLVILKDLIARKISLARAAVILKRPQSSVQIQARRLGTPFPGVRETKARLKAQIEEAEKKATLR
jgi:tRNA uridine 5-carbamoylmethylation protein Kti12